jgi:hypothetical protein
MSFLKYFFDNDRRQRDDIEELRDMQFRMASATTTGGASERCTAGMTNEMVKVGADWMCRDCARNP